MIPSRAANLYTLFCGVIPLFLGTVVLFGWHVHSIALIQVNPAFAPMQYNTALCFLLSGLGLMLLAMQRHILSRTLGFMVFSVGSATLAQYVFDIDLNIDEFLMDHSVTTKTSHPGRMAPNTALCFTITGLALVWGSRRRAIMASLAASILCLSLMALLGYLSNEESIYGWGNLTRMAIHTSLGFIVLGVGLVCYGMMRQGKKRFDLWELAPLSLAIVVLVITAFTWYSVMEATKARNAYGASGEAFTFYSNG